MKDFSYSKQAKLESIISKGKWHFIILHGVLGWGISTAVIIFLLEHFVLHTQYINSLSTALLIYPSAGFLFGLIMWRALINEHRKLLSEPSEY